MPLAGESDVLGAILNDVGREIHRLEPKDPLHQSLQAECAAAVRRPRQGRWTVIEGARGSISMPFFWVLVLWLVILFASLGLTAPANPVTTIVIALVGDLDHGRRVRHHRPRPALRRPVRHSEHVDAPRARRHDAIVGGAYSTLCVVPTGPASTARIDPLLSFPEGTERAMKAAVGATEALHITGRTPVDPPPADGRPQRASRSVPQRARSRPRRRSCPTLRGRRRSATRRSSRIKGISSSERDVATADLPPFTTLAASRLPLQACPVGRRQRRPSSPSRRGRALTSPSRRSMSNATARATANISGQKIDAGDMPGTTNPLF